MDNIDVTPKDFLPTTWRKDVDGPTWYNDSMPMYIIDESTDRRYFNESKSVVRFKCFLVALGTPFVHSVAALIFTAKRIVGAATSIFCKNFNTQQKLALAGKNIARVFTAAPSVLALEMAAIFGLFSPYNGRKLYASIERAQYGHFVLAPCFQPDPTTHAFGGDINQRNAF